MADNRLLTLSDQDTNDQLGQLLLTQGQVTDFEAKIKQQQTQQTVWVSVSLRMIKDKQGEPEWVEGSLVDISERKLKEAAEQERQKVLEDYKHLYDESIEGFFQFYPTENRLTCNKRFADMFGYGSVEELMRENFAKNFYATLPAAEITAILAEKGEVQGYEIPVASLKTGETVWVSLTMKMRQDNAKKVTRIDGSMIDITERKKREDAEKMREISEEQNKAKSQFFASMSHELRTPLTAIIGYAETANENDIGENERRLCINTIERSGHHLLRIINDILDLSKLEAQKLDIEKIPMELFDIFAEIENTFTMLAERKGLSFKFVYDFPLPEFITSDPTRVKQILLNVIGNAIKFTKTGSVIVHVSCSAEAEKINFVISDTGFGLKPEQVDNLFLAFTQADASTTRNYGGTGLGLHLSKQLAVMLGGDIMVQSLYGEGSTFTVSLATGPFANADWIESLPEHEKIGQWQIEIPQVKGHVLYAEDNKENQGLIQRIVEKTGATLRVASDGLEAMACCEQEHFDLVFTDIRMPHVDGVEFTQWLLERNPELPIIALTAILLEQELDELKLVGFKELLKNP